MSAGPVARRSLSRCARQSRRLSGGIKTARNGAAYRPIWWRAAQTFIRWGHLGVWERLLERVQERGVELGMAFLDGTSIRAHHKAAGAPKKGDLEPSAMCVKRLAGLAAAMAPRPV